MGGKISKLAAIAFGLVLLLGVGVGTAVSGRFEAGNIVVWDHGGISPKELPRHRPAPISGIFNARIGTKDGTHPPAAQTLRIDFDKTIQIDTRGLSTCSRGQLQDRSTTGARRACSDAIVGEGKAEVAVEFAEQPPFTAKGTILAFNGGTRGGKTRLLIHTYVDVPTPSAVVVETTISHISRGHYGLHTVTTIPQIAGGAGSITGFKMHLGRRFAFKGRERSYLMASCPTGRYYVEGHAAFSDGTIVHVTHVLPCTPTG